MVTLIVCATCLVVPNSCQDQAGSEQPEKTTQGASDRHGPIPRTIAGFAVTHGAAPGYIEDTACRECHAEIYDAYQSVGMARSFYPPGKDKVIEKLGEPFQHAPTGRIYEMNYRDGKLYQTRYRHDERGDRFAEYEAEVAWIIGSGNHVRSYLSHSPHGELFQLPMSWYAESGWGMSPGYDRAQHFGFERRISRHCMFCHNAYPEVPVGADLQHAAPLFPAQMPHGIGCQRCHGPGARHVEKAMDAEATQAQICQEIVNPANQPPAVRDELCMTCHLQIETLADTQMLPRAFDKPLYSHRPDRRIRDWIAFLDHGTPAEQRDRTQVNHHAYRLRFSECHTQSDGALTCTTCHDPHRKVAAAERAGFYRSKCLQCHQLTDCAQEDMGHGTDPATADCATCHMVRTRPADVVHATVTDHFIRRRHPDPDPAAPREERPDRPAPSTVTPYFDDTSGSAMWRVLAGLATAGSATPQALRDWQRAFEESRPHGPTAYVQIGAALGRRDRGAAIRLLREGVSRHPEVAEIHWELGDALWMSGQVEQAVHQLTAADELSHGENPDIARSLGIACALDGAYPRARAALERSLRMRPNDRTSWLQLANTLIQLRDLGAAAEAFERAIELAPNHADAYRGLSGVRGQLGQHEAALRVLRQGASFLPAVRLDLIAVSCLSNRPQHRDPPRGLRLARLAVAQAPDDPRNQLHLALAKVFTAPASEALQAISRARDKGADAASCEALRAITHQSRGATELARQALDRFEESSGNDTQEPLRRQLAGFLRSLSSKRRENR